MKAKVIWNFKVGSTEFFIYTVFTENKISSCLAGGKMS
jgi:hypothetical protein